MSFQKKVYQIVSKYAEEVNLREVSDAEIDEVVSLVIKSNIEYQRVDKAKIRENVEGTSRFHVLALYYKPSIMITIIKFLESLHSYVFHLKPEMKQAPTSTPAAADSSNSMLPYKRSSSEHSTRSGSSKKKQKGTMSVPQQSSSAAATSIAQSGETLTLSFQAERPAARLGDLAGIESILSLVRELVFYPIQYPDLYTTLGVRPPCGLLLNGPSGCGKTHLALSIAGELGLPFFKASGPELVGGTSGESEMMIKQLFRSAVAKAPSILFLDAIDVIAPKRDSTQSRGMDRRIVAQLYDSIDEVVNASCSNIPVALNSSKLPNGNEITIDASSSSSSSAAAAADFKSSMVILIAATSRPESLDTGLRGRFAREVSLPVPDACARTKILSLLCKDMKIDASVDFKELGRITPGFVGADLKVLTREAGMAAVRLAVESSMHSNFEMPRDIYQGLMPSVPIKPEVLSSIFINMENFVFAAKAVFPTAKREGFAVVPDVSWADVGALAEIREELTHNVLDPIAHPERFRSLGLDVPAGVLFFGPPGCGKTLLAKALANQSGANFISVKGPELLNMFVGESESRVRQVFSRARSSAPCVIFFDELDALCPKRGSGADAGGGNNVSDRVVNQLLTELDGLEVRKDVYIIGATNRLELIDDAMLRPGRLGKLLYVPLPSKDDRVSILQALARKVAVHSDVNLVAIAKDVRTEGFSGADISALVREAGLSVVKEWKESLPDVQPQICARHFEKALTSVQPSVSLKDRERYNKVHELIRAGHGPIQALQSSMLL